MHCKSCDKILNDYELRRKNRFGEYEDMCSKCLDKAGVSEYDELLDGDDDEEFDEDDLNQHLFD